MEEESGYRSTDSDSAQERDKTLNSPNPAYEELMELGLDMELPHIEVRSQTVLADDVVDDTTLSPFSKWLLSLSKPSEVIGEVRVQVQDVQVQEVQVQEDEVQEEEVQVQDVQVQDLQVQEEEVQEEKVEEEVQAEPVSPKAKRKKGKKRRKKKKDKKKSDAPSVILSDEVYSETLAELLASQGHHTEAIGMYERLSLKYPEKSRLFAAKIAELINKA